MDDLWSFQAANTCSSSTGLMTFQNLDLWVVSIHLFFFFAYSSFWSMCYCMKIDPHYKATSDHVLLGTWEAQTVSLETFFLLSWEYWNVQASQLVSFLENVIPWCPRDSIRPCKELLGRNTPENLGSLLGYLWHELTLAWSMMREHYLQSVRKGRRSIHLIYLE